MAREQEDDDAEVEKADGQGGSIDTAPAQSRLKGHIFAPQSYGLRRIQVCRLRTV
jgi:hypothetical protein